MTTMPTIKTAKLDDLFLDAKNPRLGRHEISKTLSQDDVLQLMRDWSLEELAVSFLESGFWPQEAVIVVKENVGKSKDRLVVVEGNRRIAALKMIARVCNGTETSSKWTTLVEGYSGESLSRLEHIPYILMPSRESVASYLGYRHVTGIKEWNPAEKAQFIAHLIEQEGLDYDQVRKRIGSKAPTVRQNYISFRLLLQMEGAEDIDVTKVEERFSVLFLSLRSNGVQQYLHVDIEADPKSARKGPVPPRHRQALANFAKWLFGNEKQEPIISDSRQVDDFGKILESETAVQYLERTEAPSFAVARRLAGVGEAEVAEHIELAADEVEEALKAAHQYRKSKSPRLKKAVSRLGEDVLQLLSLFPEIKSQVLEAAEE